MLRNNYHRPLQWAFALTAALTLWGCGSHRQLEDTPTDTTSPTTSQAENAGRIAIRETCLNTLRKNQVTATDLVANIDFRVQSGSKDISVDGKLSMRRNDVIRIQLSPLGLVEVGRLEFTSDSVLFMDRVHKQYLKGRYEDVDFLRDNGITFNSLQAMFWNQLYVDKKQEAGLVVSKPSDAMWKLQSEQGKMTYSWWAEVVSGLIRESALAYHSDKHGTSQLNWNYDNFKSFGKGQFPTTQQVKFKSKKKEITLTLKLKSMKADKKWDARTAVPSKYKPVSIDEVLGKIMNL